MAVGGIYVLTDPARLPAAFPALTDRLLKTFNPTPLGRWTADHRLLRSTPAAADDKSPPSHHHILSLAHRPGSAYAYIAPPAPPTSNDALPAEGGGDRVIAIPSGQADGYYALLGAKFGALWAPRAAVHVVGAAWDVGEFVVRAGEVRQVGGQQGLRAVVVGVEVKTVGEEEEAEEENGEKGVKNGGVVGKREVPEDMKALLRGMRDALGIEASREFLGTWGGKAGALEEARLWCEALRLRG